MNTIPLVSNIRAIQDLLFPDEVDPEYTLLDKFCERSKQGYMDLGLIYNSDFARDDMKEIVKRTMSFLTDVYDEFERIRIERKEFLSKFH